MTAPAVKGRQAVMNSRATEAPDALDYFPTPPWATRAVLPYLKALDPHFGRCVVWEPACGEGHMAAVLAEACGRVLASDVFDYEGRWFTEAAYADPRVARFPYDFLTEGAAPYAADWVITNPPFNTAAQFAELGLERARRGVALLVRTGWLAGADRFERLFSKRPPAMVCQYVERVPMVKGRWDPSASTATDYCWVIWRGGRDQVLPTQFRWIPPGRKAALTTARDLALFAEAKAAPLFEAAEDPELKRLGLSVRTLSILSSAGHTRLSTVAALSEAELRALSSPQVTEAVLAEIRGLMAGGES